MNSLHESTVSVSSGIEDVDLYWEDLDRYWHLPSQQGGHESNGSNPKHITPKRRQMRRARQAAAAMVSARLVS